MNKKRKVFVINCGSTSIKLAVFEEKGYKTVKVKLCNQFARTVHIETVVLLKYCKNN